MADIYDCFKNYNNFVGYVVACLTDEYVVGKWSEERELLETKADKILEIRIFNEDEEIKYFRSTIGRDFKCRTINDSQDKLENFEEKQLLDIDTLQSDRLPNQNYVISTGGGIYKRPVTDISLACVKIRNYIKKNEKTGQAEVYDWRVVSFEEK